MKTAWITLGFAALAPLMWGQTAKSPAPSKSRQEAAQALAEATRVLERARASGQTEAQRRAREKASDSGALDALITAARENRNRLPDPAEAARKNRAEEGLRRAVSTTSPEGRALLAQSEAVVPTLNVPDPTVPKAVATQPSVLSSDGPGPRPQPLKPTPLGSVAAKKESPAQTVITAVGPKSASFFDGSQSMGVFTGDVEVTHPQFHLTCDTLEVYMVKEGEKSATAPKAASKTASQLAAEGAAGAPGDSSAALPEGSSIRQAIAKGRKVVVQKPSETGEMQIGVCRHATYVGATGEMIMRDWPQVQKGTNLILATSATTVITILNDGKLKTAGPTTTKIIQEADKPGKAPAAASATTPQTQGAQQ